jgi:hypothetical protein
MLLEQNPKQSEKSTKKSMEKKWKQWKKGWKKRETVDRFEAFSFFFFVLMEGI